MKRNNIARNLTSLVILTALVLIAIYVLQPPKEVFEITGWSTDPQDYIKIEIREGGIDKAARNIEKVYLAEDRASIEELFKHLKAYELKRWYRKKNYPLEPSEKFYDISLYHESGYKSINLITNYVGIFYQGNRKVYLIKNKAEVEKGYIEGLFATVEYTDCNHCGIQLNPQGE